MTTHSSILVWRIPMDRGAWWATVQRATKSQTRLKQHVCTHTHTHTYISSWFLWPSIAQPTRASEKCSSNETSPVSPSKKQTQLLSLIKWESFIAWNIYSMGLPCPVLDVMRGHSKTLKTYFLASGSFPSVSRKRKIFGLCEEGVNSNSACLLGCCSFEAVNSRLNYTWPCAHNHVIHILINRGYSMYNFLDFWEEMYHN